jgi:hypothetical protein
MCNKEFKCTKRLLFKAHLARDKLQQITAYPLHQKALGWLLCLLIGIISQEELWILYLFVSESSFPFFKE